MDLGQLTADDERALAAWLADPSVPKAAHDVKGPLLALARRGLAAGRRHLGHPAGRLPGAARAAVLRPGGSGAALPAPRTALHRASSRPASSPWTAARTRPMTRVAEVEALRAVAVRGPGRRARRRTGRRGATDLLAELELPLTAVLADMEAVGIAADVERLTALQSELGAAVAGRGERGPRGGRASVQPGLAQATAADPVRRAGAAQDQADQDRLHHRCRRVGLAGREPRRSAAGVCCCGTGRSPG